MSTPKVALVTGASGDIGRAVCEKLAVDGYTIWAHYKSNRVAAEQLQASVRQQGAACETCEFDVACAASVKEGLANLLRTAPVHTLVVNAGVVRAQPIAFHTPELVSQIIDTNLKGLFNVLQPVVRGMIKHRSGSIIAISSIAAIRGITAHAAYSASKAGMLGAVRSLARELGPYGIRVNAVLPGLIDTKMNHGIDTAAIVAQIPLERSGTSAEVAEAVSFLSSHRASYINGAELAVTGGLNC